MNKNTIRKILNEMQTNGGFSGIGYSEGPVGVGSSPTANAAFVSDSGGYGVTDNAQFRAGFDPVTRNPIANPWAFRTSELAVATEMMYKWNMTNHNSPSNDPANDARWRAMVLPIPRTPKYLQQGTTESAFADLGFTGEDIDYLKYLLMAYINA